MMPKKNNNLLIFTAFILLLFTLIGFGGHFYLQFKTDQKAEQLIVSQLHQYYYHPEPIQAEWPPKPDDVSQYIYLIYYENKYHIELCKMAIRQFPSISNACRKRIMQVEHCSTEIANYCRPVIDNSVIMTKEEEKKFLKLVWPLMNNWDDAVRKLPDTKDLVGS